MIGKFGDKVSPFIIQKLSLAKNQKMICSIISTTIIIAKTHYIEDVGAIHCFAGKCCEVEGIPRVYYGLPVYKYQSDGHMKKIGPELEFLMLVRGNTDYANLRTKNDILEANGSNITQADLLITCTEEKYQDYDFDILGKSTWRELAGKERWKTDMEQFVTHAEANFGRKVTLDGYLKLIAKGDKPILDRPSSDQLKTTKTLPVLEEKKVTKEVVVTEDDFEDLLAR